MTSFLLFAVRGRAVAACNAIPSAIQSFRGAMGSIDRPFAGPGDWMDLGPDSCRNPGGLIGDADQFNVTVLFDPPMGSRTLLLLTPEPLAQVQSRVALCRNSAGSAPVIPRSLRVDPETGPVDVEKPRGTLPNHLRVRFPDTDEDLAGPQDDVTFTGPVRVLVTPVGQPFPCESALTECRNALNPTLLVCIDELLADGTCARVPHQQFAGGLTALPPPNDYAAICSAPAFPDGPCTAEQTESRLAVDRDGNLLVPVDWTGVLVRDAEVPVPRLLGAQTSIPAFSGLSGSVRIPGASFLESFSPEGRRLPPLFEHKVDTETSTALRLFGSADAAYTVLRLDRRAPRGACRSSGVPCTSNRECPSGDSCDRFLSCPDDPSRPCTPGAAGECSPAALSCGSSACTACVEGPRTGMACRSSADCLGGQCLPHGAACTTDEQCPDAVCGSSLFDFSDRMVSGRGPILIADVTAQALDPVPLTGLIDADSGDQVSAYVLEERIGASLAGDQCTEAGDLNGDGDCTDPVLTVQDRATGAAVAIGESSDGIEPPGLERLARGRAVARISKDGTRAPAVDVEGDLVALLESEPLQGTPAGRDANANGQSFETTVRVFDRSGRERTAGIDPSLLTADADPVIDGKSLVLSNGRVFFRTFEPDLVPRTVVDLTPDAAVTGRLIARDIATSADGRVVAFESDAFDLVPGDTNRLRDVFVYDRDTDGDGIFDQEGGTSVERVSVTSLGEQLDGTSVRPTVSGDGRLVAFASRAQNLLSCDLNGPGFDVFVHDRMTGATTPVATAEAVHTEVGFDFSDPVVCRSFAGSFGDEVVAPALSADGHFLAAYAQCGGPGLPGTECSLVPSPIVVDLGDGVATEAVRPVQMLKPGCGHLSTGFSLAVTDQAEIDPPAISRDGDIVAFECTNDITPFRFFGIARRSQDQVTFVEVLEAGALTDASLGLSADGRHLAIPSDDGTTLRIVDTVTGTSATVRLPKLPAFLTEFGRPSLSADGRFLAVESATGPSGVDVYVYDRDADGNGTLDEPDGGVSLEIASAFFDDATCPQGPCSVVSSGVLSSDGRHLTVAISSSTLARGAIQTVASIDFDPRTTQVASLGDPQSPSLTLDVGVAQRAPGLAPLAVINTAADFASFPRTSFLIDPNASPQIRPIEFGDDVSLAFPLQSALAGDGSFVAAVGSPFTGVELRTGTTRLRPTLEAEGPPICAFDLVDGSYACVPEPDLNSPRSVGSVHTAQPFAVPPSSELVSTDGGNLFAVDFDADGDGRFGPGGTTVREIRIPGAPFVSALAASDGARFVLLATNLPLSLFVLDRDGDDDGKLDERGDVGLERVDVSSIGTPAEDRGVYSEGVLSADGRYALFHSFDVTLTPGDTNGRHDIFLRDRRVGATTRLSLASNGDELGPEDVGSSFGASRDARMVAFGQAPLFSEDLPYLRDPARRKVFVTDRVTGATLDVSLGVDGQTSLLGTDTSPFGDVPPLTISPDGRFVAFVGRALDPTAVNASDHLLVRGPYGAIDLDHNGHTADTVLRVLEVNGAVPGIQSLGPAAAVSVDGDTAAFVSPVPDAPTGTPEGRVMLWTASGGAPVDLGRVATDVVLRGPVLAAALVSQGTAPHLGVYRLDGGGWVDTGLAVGSMDVVGNLVVFTVPEPPSGCGDVEADRLGQLHVFDASTGTLAIGPHGLPPPVVRDFVATGSAGNEFVAFRVAECAAGKRLNDDRDKRDDVMHVYDHRRGAIYNTGASARACRLEACDPRLPYRLTTTSITFLAFECDESVSRTTGGRCTGGLGTDLDGNGVIGDIVVRTLPTHAGASATRPKGSVLGSAKAGVCTGYATPCFDNGDCVDPDGNAGVCFVPPGGCVRESFSSCRPDPKQPEDRCPSEQEFCLPTGKDVGVCYELLGIDCARDAECRDPRLPNTDPLAFCNAGSQVHQRLVSPLTRSADSQLGSGASVFAGTGRCVEDLATPCDPTAGAKRPGSCRRGTCTQNSSAAFTCQREVRTCRRDEDCPRGIACQLDLLTSTAADVDHDGIPDVLDVCPTVADPDQGDTDGDGTGDACDPTACNAGASLASIRCRAVLLVDETMRSTSDGPLRTTLVRALELARTNLDEGDRPGRPGNTALRRAVRRLRSYAHRVRSLSGRTLTPAARDTLAAAATGIVADVRTAYRSRR